MDNNEVTLCNHLPNFLSKKERFDVFREITSIDELYQLDCIEKNLLTISLAFFVYKFRTDSDDENHISYVQIYDAIAKYDYLDAFKGCRVESCNIELLIKIYSLLIRVNKSEGSLAYLYNRVVTSLPNALTPGYTQKGERKLLSKRKSGSKILIPCCQYCGSISNLISTDDCRAISVCKDVLVSNGEFYRSAKILALLMNVHISFYDTFAELPENESFDTIYLSRPIRTFELKGTTGLIFQCSKHLSESGVMYCDVPVNLASDYNLLDKREFIVSRTNLTHVHHFMYFYDNDYTSQRLQCVLLVIEGGTHRGCDLQVSVEIDRIDEYFLPKESILKSYTIDMTYDMAKNRLWIIDQPENLRNPVHFKDLVGKISLVKGKDVVGSKSKSDRDFGALYVDKDVIVNDCT